MAQITGGSVTYGRTVQPAQYESKKSEVTITFTVSEDDTPEQAKAILNEVATLAQAKALELVGLQKAPATVAAAAPAGDKVLDEPREGAAAAQRRTRKRAEPAAAASEGEDLLPARDTKAEAANEAAEAAKDRAAHAEKMAEANLQSTKPADADDDLLGGAEQPISDKDLMDAVTKKMNEINNGPAIKGVREKFVPGPKGIRDIPQEKRKDFLAELAKLKK